MSAALCAHHCVAASHLQRSKRLILLPACTSTWVCPDTSCVSSRLVHVNCVTYSRPSLAVNIRGPFLSNGYKRQWDSAACDALCHSRTRGALCHSRTRGALCHSSLFRTLYFLLQSVMNKNKHCLERRRDSYVGMAFRYGLDGPGIKSCRSQWPSGLRWGSAADRLLGLRVRISPEARTFVLCVVNKDRAKCRTFKTKRIQKTTIWWTFILQIVPPNVYVEPVNCEKIWVHAVAFLEMGLPYVSFQGGIRQWK